MSELENEIIEEIEQADPFINVYVYDEEGFYSHVEKAQLNPVSQADYLMPPNSTETKPLEKKGFVSQWDREFWKLVIDNRGVKYYDNDGVYEITEVGIDIPKNVSLEPAPSIFHKWNGKEWIYDAEAEKKSKVPKALSRFQALTVLKLTKIDDTTTLYQATDQYIDSLSDDTVENITAKTAWETAQEFRRDSSLILMAQAMFGLTEEQVDEMFIQGASITA